MKASGLRHARVFAFHSTPRGPACRGGAGPAVAGQSSQLLPWLWAGCLQNGQQDLSILDALSFHLAAESAVQDLGLIVLLGSGEPRPGLSTSLESLFRELPSTFGVVPFPKCLYRYMIPRTCDLKMFQGILNCFAFY